VDNDSAINNYDGHSLYIQKTVTGIRQCLAANQSRADHSCD